MKIQGIRPWLRLKSGIRLDKKCPFRHDSVVTTLQKLQSKVAALPENLAVEVLDFVEHLAAKRASDQRGKEGAISRYRGAFKGTLSSSDEFSKRKSDEIGLER